MKLIYANLFVASFALSLILTRFVRNLAARRGWASAPSSHHIHQRPIPRLGGVAIFLSFFAITAVLWVASSRWKLDLGFSPHIMWYILAPGSLIFLLGLYDDLYSVKPQVKIAVQIVAAVMLYAGGIGKFNLPLVLGLPGMEWMTLPMIIVWVLFITNAFNLIDGLDGLAAGAAQFAIVVVFVFSLMSGSYLVPILAIVLAGAVLGFLPFNFNPATIFLGDSGSLFLGFMLSALSLRGSQKASTAIAVAIPLIAFGLPILETSISIIRRFLSGRPLFSADREHIHHKLLERGLSHSQAVIVLYGVSALCGLLSLFLLRPGIGVGATVFFILGIGIWKGVKHLGYHEFDELRRLAQRTVDQKKVISNNLAIRRASNKLASAQSFHQLCSILQEAFETNDFGGYQLSLHPTSAQYPGATAQELVAEWWKGKGHSLGDDLAQCNHDDHRPTPAWALTLELEATGKQRCGHFSLYCMQGEGPLLVDVNILLSEFRIALANAVSRMLIQQAQPEEITEEIARLPILVDSLGIKGEQVPAFGLESA